MTKERIFKKEYGNELLEVAYGDLLDAKKLYKSEAARKENIFFLCQQALEKALKAGLILLEKPVPLVHDIALLMDRYPQNIQLPIPDEVKELSEFATIRRYEGSIANYSKEEIEASLEVTKKLIDWVKKIPDTI